MNTNILVSLSPDELSVIREAIVIAQSNYELQLKMFLDNARRISDRSSIVRSSFINSAFEKKRQIDKINRLLNDSSISYHYNNSSLNTKEKYE